MFILSRAKPSLSPTIVSVHLSSIISIIHCHKTEIVHLKQRLAESRQASIRLELQCAQLKTEGARLQGSQQALITIREQLMAENNSLDRGQRSLRENWDRERDEMTNEITLLHHELNEVS